MEQFQEHTHSFTELYNFLIPGCFHLRYEALCFRTYAHTACAFTNFYFALLLCLFAEGFMYLQRDSENK